MRYGGRRFRIRHAANFLWIQSSKRIPARIEPLRRPAGYVSIRMRPMRNARPLSLAADVDCAAPSLAMLPIAPKYEIALAALTR